MSRHFNRNTGSIITLVEERHYQSLQQKVSELEAELKESRKQLDDNAKISADNLLDVYDKYEKAKAENKRLADEARLLRFHITKELPNSKEIYECIAKALKGEEK